MSDELKPRADEPQAIKNAENYKLTDDSKPQVIAIGEKHELADIRERLEADVRWQLGHFFAWDEKRKELVGYVLEWLDRQAAITRRETRQNWQDAPNILDRENLRTIDRLTAERDELERANERQARKIHDVCELNEKLTAERDGLRKQFAEGLRKELDRRCDLLKERIAEQDRRIVEYAEQVDDLTAELEETQKKLRDCSREVFRRIAENNTLRNRNSFLNDTMTEQIAKLLDENDCIEVSERGIGGKRRLVTGTQHKLEKQVEELTAERDELRRVVKIQADSFAKMERERRELQDVCGELERTIENMRGD